MDASPFHPQIWEPPKVGRCKSWHPGYRWLKYKRGCKCRINGSCGKGRWSWRRFDHSKFPTINTHIDRIQPTNSVSSIRKGNLYPFTPRRNAQRLKNIPRRHLHNWIINCTWTAANIDRLAIRHSDKHTGGCDASP